MSAKHPMQPVERDDHGTIRFKRNKLVDYLLKRASEHGCDLNHLAIMNFSQEDEEQFAQLIGYSVDGFASLSYVSDKAYGLANAASLRLQSNERRRKRKARAK